ncbi:hypothetical protein HaLaN_03561 [Haematococcus lacustris]|uniref:Uncharacterized protein n=1 Tax=Haematococcus lacustris TaxID=44745 RepID=A0A699YKR8_HAELA|nr:hypothetical protein HaLaN_03561 [Haematococcus lacustris]
MSQEDWAGSWQHTPCAEGWGVLGSAGWRLSGSSTARAVKREVLTTNCAQGFDQPHIYREHEHDRHELAVEAVLATMTSVSRGGATDRWTSDVCSHKKPLCLWVSLAWAWANSHAAAGSRSGTRFAVLAETFFNRIHNITSLPM